MRRGARLHRAAPGEAGARAEIVLTQTTSARSARQGAIASGITMLLHVAAVPLERVEELMLAAASATTSRSPARSGSG